jgi:hypothetical protein
MSDSDDLRTRAINRLKAKQHFWSILVTWIALSALFIVIWAVTGAGVFWPVWPILGIAIGVVATGIRAFGPTSGGPTDAQIRSEMDKLGGS